VSIKSFRGVLQSALVALPVLVGCQADTSGSRLGQLAESARVVAAMGPPPATSPASLLRDSTSGDSAALASLPAALRADFDVDAEMARARDGGDSCREISDSTETDIRKRLRIQEEEQLLVLFVRANRRSGELHRVELLRRLGAGPQRAWIWDTGRAEMEAVEWIEGRQQRFTVPPGTPTPRALRALGRRLLVLKCG
jgi:hypothetical protein